MSHRRVADVSRRRCPLLYHLSSRRDRLM